MQVNKSEARIERQRDARRENERPIGCEGVGRAMSPADSPTLDLEIRSKLVRRTFANILVP